MNQNVPVKISFWSAVLMSINIIVGAGIYFNPGPMAAIAGGFSFLGWILVGLVLYPIIWSLSQAVQVFPGEGGFYNYCKTGINDTAGFLANWAYILGYTGTAGVYCLFIKDLLVKQAGLTFIHEYSVLVNVVLIGIFLLLNLIKVDLIAKLQSAAAIVKVIPLVFVIAVCAFYFGPHVTYVSSDIANLGYTLPVAIFAFFGFETCCSMSGMIEGGAKAAGRVIIAAFLISMVLYTLFHIGLTYIMGVDQLAQFGPVGFPKFLGFGESITSIMQSMIAFFIIFSACNAFYGVSSMNIGNIFCLAKKNVLFGSSSLSKTNANQRPIMAILVYGLGLFGLVTFIPNMLVMTALTGLGICSAFTMTVVALMLTFFKKQDYVRFAMSIIALVSCAIFLYFSWMLIGQDNMTRLMNASPVLVGALVGFAMYKVQTGCCSIGKQPGK